MHFEDIEPLEPGHWMRRMRQLAAWTLADENEIERALRHAFHLVQLTPRPLRHFIHCTRSEAEFEALLEARAFEAAVMCLLGNHTPYNLTDSNDGQQVTAEVWYSDQHVRHKASERSPTLALFRAWLECTTAIDQAEEPEPSVCAPMLMPGDTTTQH